MDNVTAQYLAMGLELGIRSVDDVNRWVDHQAVKTSELSGALLELTYLKNGSPLDVISLLDRIPPKEEHITVLIRLLGDIPEHKKNDNAFCKNLSEELFRVFVHSNNDMPEALIQLCLLGEEYDLAQKGIMHKDTDDWHQTFKKHIDPFEHDG